MRIRAGMIAILILLTLRVNAKTCADKIYTAWKGSTRAAVAVNLLPLGTFFSPVYAIDAISQREDWNLLKAVRLVENADGNSEKVDKARRLLRKNYDRLVKWYPLIYLRYDEFLEILNDVNETGANIGFCSGALTHGEYRSILSRVFDNGVNSYLLYKNKIAKTARTKKENQDKTREALLKAQQMREGTVEYY